MERKGTLIALTVSALALAAVLVLGGERGGKVAGGPRLVPEWSSAAIERIQIARAGETVTLARDDDGVLVLPGRATDDRAVDDLLGTLELLAWERRVEAADAAARGLDDPRVVVTIDVEGGPGVELRLGDIAEATDQAWLSVAGDDDHHYLIAGYAARALDRGGGDFRARRVFDAPPEAITGVEIFAEGVALVLGGRPPAVALDGGGRVRADAARAAALIERLRGLRQRRFVDGAAPDREPELTVRVIGPAGPAELASYGACPGADDGTLLVSSPVGVGCVGGAALHAITREAADPGAFVETRLVPPDVTAVAFGAVRLERAGGGWTITAGHGAAPVEADPDTVDELLRAANTAATGDVVPALPGEPAPVYAIVVERGGGAEERLDIVRSGDVLAAKRPEDTGYLLLDPDTAIAAPPDPELLGDRQLLVLQPTACRALDVIDESGSVRVTRGEVVGEWEAPEGRVADATAADRVCRAVATLRAERFTGGALAPRRTVVATFDAPPGANAYVEVRIQLGARCRARFSDGPVFVLDDDRCAALSAPLLRPR